MGPVRGRLTAALSLLPAPALADACTGLRDGWVAGDSPVSALAEASYILISPPGIVVLVLLAVALWKPRPWLSAMLSFPALAFAALILFSRQAPSAVQAQAEGCIGTPYLALVLLAGLAGLAVVRGWRRG